MEVARAASLTIVPPSGQIPNEPSEPVPLIGLPAKIANACRARELIVAMQAADALARSRCFGTTIDKDRVGEIADRAMEVVKICHVKNHSPESVVALVETSIEHEIGKSLAN